jgi:hypothetical protein
MIPKIRVHSLLKEFSGLQYQTIKIFLQVFKNDEHVVDFLATPNDSLGVLDDQIDIVISKYYVSVESLFTRDD